MKTKFYNHSIDRIFNDTNYLMCFFALTLIKNEQKFKTATCIPSHQMLPFLYIIVNFKIMVHAIAEL